jgi:hypothetical protein
MTIISLCFINTNVIADNDTNYTKWIGPTMAPNPSPHLIDSTGYNMTLLGLFGSNDTVNSTVDDINLMAMVGGITWPYNGIGPVVIMIIGFVIGIVMYMKLDGDLLIPGGILMLTGILSTGTAFAVKVPIEMLLFCTLSFICGVGVIVYQAVYGRGE